MTFCGYSFVLIRDGYLYQNEAAGLFYANFAKRMAAEFIQ
jgi:hypothetical protein